MSDKDFFNEDNQSLVVSSLEYIDYLERYVPEQPPIKTGLPMLDYWMGGGAVPGDLWLLSGPSKHGKSTFLRTLIHKYYQQHVLSMVFTYEETPQLFFKKFEGLAKDLLFYLPRVRKAYDIDKMLEQATEAIERYGVRIMFVDTGQKVVEDVQRDANLAHVCGMMASRLKNFAIDKNVIVWMTWHLKKNENVTLAQLSPSLLRDTERLFQESDGLIFMYRNVNSQGVSKTQENWLKIAATRRGDAFNEEIPIVKHGPYFRELEDSDVV